MVLKYLCLVPGFYYNTFYCNNIRIFPTRAKKADFDLISLIGPYLYVFIFQLVFPVILSVYNLCLLPLNIYT